jgi:hypothetical protein
MINNEKKFIFVFITTNLINKKQYIGDHSTNNLDKDYYLGSGIYFKRAVKECNEQNFKREILEFFSTKQEAFNAQEKYIKEYNTLVPNGYNISPTGGHGVKGCWSEESKKKSSNRQKGKPNIHKGKTYEQLMTDLYGEEKGMLKALRRREKLKKSKMGKRVSKETALKISKTKQGVKHTKEQNEKLSKILKGKKKPPRTKQHTQKIIKNRELNGWQTWNKGLTKETDERVKKYSESSGKSRKGKPSNMSGKKHKPESIEKLKSTLLNKKLKNKENENCG